MILIIDDSAVRSSLNFMLKRAGHRPYLYPRSTDAPRMHLFFADLCRRIDQIPDYFSLIVSNKNSSSVKQTFFGTQIPVPLPRSIQQDIRYETNDERYIDVLSFIDNQYSP